MTGHRRRGGPVGLLCMSLSVCTALVALPTGSAAASPQLTDARARAAALRHQLDALTNQAEVATERYDGVQARLGALVTERMLAQQQLDTARQAAAAGTSTLDDRVRALYMSGGQAALLATVLDGSDLSDVAHRYSAVASLVNADQSNVASDNSLVRQSATIDARLRELTARQTRLQQQAARASDAITAALGRQRTLLAAAAADVRRIAAADRKAAALAAAAAFAQRLAAAQAQLAAGSGPFDTSGLGGGTSAPAGSAAAIAIAAARSRLGNPYVWGATGPTTFDCSGLTQWSYAHAGVALPRVAADQWNSGPHPGLAALAPGDLLFWANDVTDPTSIHHVAIYLGGGLMLDAPHTGDVVKIEPVYLTGYIGATRPTASSGS